MHHVAETRGVTNEMSPHFGHLDPSYLNNNLSVARIGLRLTILTSNIGQLMEVDTNALLAKAKGYSF